MRETLLTQRVRRGSKNYNILLRRGFVERGDWLVIPEPEPLYVTNQIVQQMDVPSIITKLDEVIEVMQSFDIQVNLGNIFDAIYDVADQFSFLEDKEMGYPKMMKLLEDVQTKLKDSNDGIKLLSDKYAKLATCIATRDDKLFQSIGDLVNQQKAEIQESNRYLK